MNIQPSKKTISILLSILLAACTSASSNHRYHQKKPTPTLWQTLQQQQTLNHQTHQQAVQLQIKNYCRHAYQIEHTLQQSIPYITTIAQQTTAANLPSELALIPYIESHYNPHAYSRTGATGLWQMMPGTASGFGLRINWWVDQRKDINAATQAALAYLNYLYSYFDHNWLLAIAAYDAGEGTIKNAIRRNKQQNKATDFWSLKLPKETKTYIPRLLALAEILQNPEKCNLKLPNSSPSPLVATPINHQISFKKVAFITNSSEQQIKTLNPQYLHNMTEHNQPEQYILLPKLAAEKLQQYLAKTTIHSPIKWQHHKVNSGDTLASIASQYRTTPAAIITSNQIQNQRIKTGSHLLIPSGEITQLTEHLKFKPTYNKIKYQHGPQQRLHIIKANETLTNIAHQYHITAGMIRYWNPKDAHKPLNVGKQLVLWLPRSNKFDQYLVAPDDNLSTIAHSFNVNVHDLKYYNGLTTNIIHPGQTLKIPISSSQSNTKHPLTYIIQPGDSLYAIAHKHHISVNDIKTWNQMQDSSMIHPGQSLTLYR